MDEAIEWVKRARPSSGGVEIEIRPVFEAEDFGDAMSPELREQEERLREQTEAAAVVADALRDRRRTARSRRSGGSSRPGSSPAWRASCATSASPRSSRRTRSSPRSSSGPSRASRTTRAPGSWPPPSTARSTCSAGSTTLERKHEELGRELELERDRADATSTPRSTTTSATTSCA